MNSKGDIIGPPIFLSAIIELGACRVSEII